MPYSSCARARGLAVTLVAPIVWCVPSAIADDLLVPSEFPSIGAAVDAATPGDSVVIADGVYDGEDNWDVVIDIPLTVRSASGDPARVMILGPDIGIELPNNRAFVVAASGEAEFFDITFRALTGVDGGAVLIEDGQARFAGCVFDGNRSGHEFDCGVSTGGAVGLFGGSAVFEACVFDGNRSSPAACTGTGDAHGGAIGAVDASVEALDCTFRGNEAWGVGSGQGGAIYGGNGSVVHVRDCRFEGNSSQGDFGVSGGAIAMVNSRLEAARSSFTGNQTFSSDIADSGAILIRGGTADMVSCEFRDNVVNPSGDAYFNYGGALYARFGAEVTLTNAVFEGNEVRMDNACDYNDWVARGGAIAVDRASLTLNHCTIVDNPSACPGMIYASGSIDPAVITVRNSILRGGDTVFDFVSGVEATVSYSNIEGGFPGEGNIDADPLLTPDFMLGEGSPSIDTGSIFLVPMDTLDLDGDGDAGEQLPYDLAGGLRVIGAEPDMGAFEVQGCRADIDGDGELTIFDFLAFQNAFDALDPIADFDGDGELTIFDFLAFQNAFDAGCA